MNNRLSIAKIAVALPIDRIFDYYIPQSLSDKVLIGNRVNIRFNNKNAIGYVTKCCSESKIRKLNPIVGTVDKGPLLTEFTLQLAKKISGHYICSLGEAIEVMLPNALKRSINIKTALSFCNPFKIKNKKSVIIYIQDISNRETFIFFKEEIIKRLKDKKRVIFVVPEIEMIKSVSEYFTGTDNINIGIWHGRLSKKKMLDLWDDIANDKVDMIIGTRSSIFAPLKNLGLIIIKDEDSHSHKDDQVPYYHAAEIAQMRSEIEHCDIILSSVIPSLKTHQLVLNKKILSKNIADTKSSAMIQMMGINYKDKVDVMLEKEIASALEKKEKILVFLNRKGFATFIYCKKCNEMLKCTRCSSNLRFDYSTKQLKCPNCSYKTEQVEICPKCNSTYVKYGGLGMEKLESILKRNFPIAKIITVDDLLKTNTKEISYDIIVATRKIIGFHDFIPDITVIWDLDGLLNIGDFHSGEEAYNLLSKLLIMTTKKMIICSGLNQEFYLLKNLSGLKFKDFYKDELLVRKELKLPPYFHLVLISIRGLDKNNVQITCLRLFSALERLKSRDINVSNYYTNSHLRLREKFYSYILVKSKNIRQLNKILKRDIRKFRSNKVVITVNIDPA